MDDDSDDIDLFRQALDNVTPLEGNRVEPARKRLKPIPGQRIADDRRVLDELAEASPFDVDAETGDELLYVRPGVQQKLLRKLRRGQFSIGAALDLHGKTVAEAQEALAEFFDAHHNPGNLLRFGEERAGEFAAYDEFNPRMRIRVDDNGVFIEPGSADVGNEFFLNFSAGEAGQPLGEEAWDLRRRRDEARRRPKTA